MCMGTGFTGVNWPDSSRTGHERAPIKPMRTRLRPARPSLQQTRRNIASLAARLMAEDGITDYGTAKRKAARQLHLAETEALPTNAEVEIELRTYQALYQGEEQTARLDTLRRAAIEAMRLLQGFSPYLTGPVLDGTAGRYAAVDLLLFTDAAKDVELFLLGRGMPYRHVETKRPPGDGAEIHIECEIAGETVRIAVLGADEERLRRRSPHSGRVNDRATLAAVEALIGQRA